MTKANEDLQQHGHEEHQPVSVLVNNRPVTVEGPKTTGQEIKKAAISDGVAIQTDFHLTVVDDDGKEDPVRDDEAIVVHCDEQFFAVAGDDNS